MADSTFNDPRLWLNDLTGPILQNQVGNETDKRKWSALNDLQEPFIKRFNTGCENDLVTQLEKQNNETSDIDLSPSELRQKRKEQNRAAQRAFRKRKERHVKELEDKVAELEQSRINESKHLKEENEALRLKVTQMETEIYTLKGAESAFKLSIQKLREAGIQLPTDATTPLATPPESESSFSTTPNQQQQQYTSPSSVFSAASSSSPLTAIDHSMDDRFLDNHPNDIQPSASSPPQKGHQHHHPEGQYPSSNKSNYTLASTPSNILATEGVHSVGFAASETDRFDHQPDPLVEQGAKMIPYSQVWEKLQDHPKYDMFDIDLLCEDLKKKARCSGSGAVILEEDFYSILEKHDI